MMKNLLTTLFFCFGLNLLIAQSQSRSVPIDLDEGNNARTQVIAMDLIVQGSECVGLDCVNSESFGFDTERLKENNLRIHFDDTSNSASFPKRDWRIVINDSGNGGAEYFGIEDATAGRQVFRIEGNAPLNALYVSDAGDVGIGTDVPVVEVHAVDGNTPALRLEQNGSNGFTPQTWDVAGNETNFFVRDVTNGSKLPFRIRPSAPDNSIYIDTDGDVGMGTSSPDATMHVRRTNASVDEYLHVEGAGTMFNRFESTDGGAIQLYFRTDDGNNRRLIAQDNGGTIQSQINMRDGGMFEFYPTAAATFSRLTAGSTALTASSSRALKSNIEKFEVPDILERISNVPVTTYSWKREVSSEELAGKKVIGLIAQDFYTIFQSGLETEINGQDVQMALWMASQKLHENDMELKAELEEKNARIKDLEEQMSVLVQRLEDIEALVSEVNVNGVLLKGNKASLGQNYPNPYEHGTVIEYFLPEGSNKAELIFTDNSGKKIREITVEGAGRGRVNLSAVDLTAGSYNYSLVINGSIIDTKKMVLLK